MTVPRQEAERLVASCDRLARLVGRRYWRAAGFAGDPDDYYAEAVVGLWRAALLFDPARGVKYVTYAYRWAARYAREHAEREAARGVHAPRRLGIRPVVAIALSQLTGDGDRPFDPADHRAADPAPAADVWAAVDRLLPDARERLAVWLYYRCGWSDPEVAAAIGRTRARAHQIRTAALARLRRHAGQLSRDLDLDLEPLGDDP